MFFYTPDVKGLKYTLNEEESLHAVRVLRLKEGDVITLVDGRGGLYEARIVEAHHKRCEIEVFEHFADYGKRPYYLHIAIAPTKNIDRFEWFLEKATEIGIDEITPLLCERSERKQVNIERLQRVMVAAMKQSKKAYLPQLNEMIPFDKWLKKYKIEAGLAPTLNMYIATCTGDHFGSPMPGFGGICNAAVQTLNNKQHLKTAYQAGQDAIIVIGPEGDFSENELTQAFQYGFTPITLGKSRLRTETAGVAACHSLFFINEK